MPSAACGLAPSVVRHRPVYSLAYCAAGSTQRSRSAASRAGPAWCRRRASRSACSAGRVRRWVRARGRGRGSGDMLWCRFPGRICFGCACACWPEREFIYSLPKPADEKQAQLAAEAEAAVQRTELQTCRNWLQQGKRGGMTQSERGMHAGGGVWQSRGIGRSGRGEGAQLSCWAGCHKSDIGAGPARASPLWPPCYASL